MHWAPHCNEVANTIDFVKYNRLAVRNCLDGIVRCRLDYFLNRLKGCEIYLYGSTKTYKGVINSEKDIYKAILGIREQ